MRRSVLKVLCKVNLEYRFCTNVTQRMDRIHVKTKQLFYIPYWYRIFILFNLIKEMCVIFGLDFLFPFTFLCNL